MANGRFVHPIVQGIESARGQFQDFFRSQAQVQLFQAERERREREGQRKTALDILKAAEALKDPEQRVGFLRRAARLTGVTIPPEIDAELASLASNDAFLRSMKRLPDLILDLGRERAIEATPTGRLEALATEQALTGVPAVQTIAPTQEAQLLAGQMGSFIRRGEALPEDVRKAAAEYVRERVAPSEQLRRLQAGFPTPPGGQEEVTVTEKGGRPEVTRKVTTQRGALTFQVFDENGKRVAVGLDPRTGEPVSRTVLGKAPAKGTDFVTQAFTDAQGNRVVAGIGKADGALRFRLNLGATRESHQFNLGQFRARLALRGRNKTTGDQSIDTLTPDEARAVLQDLNRTDFLTMLLRGDLGGAGGRSREQARTPEEEADDFLKGLQ